MSTNKNRMRDSRLLIVFALLISLVSRPTAASGSPLDEFMEVMGFFMLAACAIGRIYSTVFIGGIKSDKLVTVGPYSMCRNPLYFYSILGAAGVGMMSREWTLFVMLAGGFIIIYHFLIQREEAFLSQKFGTDFTAFVTSTPRLLPNFSKFSAPEELPFQPKYVNKAVWDAVWWLAAAPIFEIIRYLHENGIIKPLFTLI